MRSALDKWCPTFFFDCVQIPGQFVSKTDTNTIQIGTTLAQFFTRSGGSGSEPTEITQNQKLFNFRDEASEILTSMHLKTESEEKR